MPNKTDSDLPSTVELTQEQLASSCVEDAESFLGNGDATMARRMLDLAKEILGSRHSKEIARIRHRIEIVLEKLDQ